VTVLAAPHATQAQVTNEAPPESFDLSLCSKPSVAQSSNPVARDLRTEFRDLFFDVCRVKEDYNEGGFRGMLERQFGTVQDLIVDVFTGRGLHPTIGRIVPEGGIALGAALNDDGRQMAGEASEAVARTARTPPDSLGGHVDPWGPYALRGRARQPLDVTVVQSARAAERGHFCRSDAKLIRGNFNAVA